MTDLTDALLADGPETFDRNAWLSWRKSGIGASDVAGIAGLSKWASPMSIWTDKMGLTPDEDNEVFEYGRRAEPMLADYFEDRSGLFLVDRQAQVIHPDFPHHRATLDGRVCEHPDGPPLGVGELKTTGWEEWSEIPDYYACQGLWQMHVDQADHAWFGALHGKRFRIYELDRDQASIDALVRMVDRFWTDHVLAEVPPPADGHEATAAALARAFPNPVEGATASLDGVLTALDERERCKALMSEAKVDLARAENAIKAALGDAEIGTIKGEPVIAWKRVERNGYTVKPTSFRQLSKVGPR